MAQHQEGYGVCRSVEDAKMIAATAEREGLKGCYPSAAVVLSAALSDRENEREAMRGRPDPQPAKPFNYIAEALRTNSPSWHGDKVSFPVFQVVLQEAIEALANLDAIKKTLFYGRDLPIRLQVIEHDSRNNCEKLPVWFKDEKFGANIIHGIIGIATEAGELLEAFKNTVVNCNEFDEINAKEEIGDMFWYMAILADTCGFSFDEAQRINIAKLHARYPEKFTAELANVRNLKKERSILSKTLDMLF